MKKHALQLLVCISLLLIYVQAASTATSFCKCTCFNNSTIIALNPPSSTPSSSTTASPHLTCTACNRAFCLSYNLPICRDANKETDVFATCFQRDSLKDEAVVIVFVVATAGLLAWAVARPWVEKMGWVVGGGE